jgi:hypothetical protein
MNTRESHAWPRPPISLALGLGFSMGLLALGGVHIPTTQARPPARPLLAPLPSGTDPISNALNVPVDSNVSITFDEPISMTSVTTHTFAVYGSMSPIFTGDYSLSNFSRTVTLDPAHAFFPGERIDASVTTATLNITGEQAISSTVWQFWAAVEGGSGLFVGNGQSLGSAESYDVALGDVDGDGDLDAFVANYNGANRMWRNDGAGNFSSGWTQSSGIRNSHGVALGDVARSLR